MAKMCRLVFVLLTGLLAFLPVASAFATECGRTYSIRVTKHFPPYYLTDETGRHSGMEVEFAKMVMAAAGCKYRLALRPWRRALLQLEQGELDILGVASKTAEREVYARFSNPYRREVVGLLMRKADMDRPIRSLTDLARHNLSAVFLRGAYHGPGFAELEKSQGFDRTFRPVTTVYESVLPLKKERIDAILSDTIALSIYVRNEGLNDDLAVHPYTEYENNVHFMMSRKSVSAEQAERINRAIAMVLADPANPFADWLPN